MGRTDVRVGKNRPATALTAAEMPRRQENLPRQRRQAITGVFKTGRCQPGDHGLARRPTPTSMPAENRLSMAMRSCYVDDDLRTVER